MLYIAYAVLWLLRFALGACVFSFLGVVVWRLPRRESVVKGRSHCPVCGRTLSAACAPVPVHMPSAARPHRRRWRSSCSVF